MARIQILPLPTVKAGEYEQTPFILILDQVDQHTENWPLAMLDQLKIDTGAVTVIAHASTLDAPGALELTDEQRDALVAYLTVPPRITLGYDADAEAAATAMRTGNDRLQLIPEEPTYERTLLADVLRTALRTS